MYSSKFKYIINEKTLNNNNNLNSKSLIKKTEKSFRKKIIINKIYFILLQKKINYKNENKDVSYDEMIFKNALQFDKKFLQ